MKLSRRLFLKKTPLYSLIPLAIPNLALSNTNAHSSESHQYELNNSTHHVNHRNDEFYTWIPTETIFQHGIASGDPLDDAVILWTRITPTDTEKNNAVTVKYQLSTDKTFSNIEQSGSLFTDRERDFTVKFDVKGLTSQQVYYYRFIYQYLSYYSVSDVGTTKTLPTGDVRQVTIATTSCSHYGFGYFNVYARMAEMKDIDVVLHLGDYLYEYGNDHIYRNWLLFNRKVLPQHEMVTLDDYRLRHATYKTDQDLQQLHKTHPMIAIWDDHEFTNDAWRDGAENHDSSEGDWRTRANAAIQAYYEWMPIREPAGSDSRTAMREKSYRQFRFGNLINLTMIDTRYIGRDKQLPFDDPEFYNEQRTLLGTEQEAWLEDQLISAQNEGVRWKLIGQQVQMMQVKFVTDLKNGRPIYVNNDSWDGYPAARQRLLNLITREEIDNTIFLTGDVHSSWAAAITPDPFDIFKFNPITQDGAIAIEFVTPSVTSPHFPIPLPGLQKVISGKLVKLLRLCNPHIRYIEGSNRGFMKFTINHQEVKADWYHVPIVTIKSHLMFCHKKLRVESGIAKIKRG